MDEKMTFEDFVKGLDPFTESFTVLMHKNLTEKGYMAEIKPAAQGPVVSYQTPKPKRTVFNYVFRKTGMQVRIYGDNAHTYQDFLQTLPDEMIASIAKAGQCKVCNSRCPKGYSVTIKGNAYDKCRYGAFLFAFNKNTQPYIKTFIEKEISAREKSK